MTGWLETYAPETARYRVVTHEVPPEASRLADEQRLYLAAFLARAPRASARTAATRGRR